MNKKTNNDLSGIQQDVLGRLNAGGKFNLLAYPFIEDHCDFFLSVRMIWAVFGLRYDQLITVEESCAENDTDDYSLWMEITEKGRCALESRKS